MDGKIIIQLSKKKTLVAIIGSAFFVLSGYLMVINPEKFVSSIFRNQETIRISGIAGVVFFGICFVIIVLKLFDKKPGLIIDQFGITNNSNATSMGLIEWDDITGIEKKQIMSTKFLILHTNKPEKYINRAKHSISKYAMKLNFKTYGSPISIASNSLKINFDELETLITSEYESREDFRS